MSFQDPGWLWLLALVPVLLLLARRGTVTREREVASLFLWRKALAAETAKTIARRRPIPPALWAWVGVVTALILGLSEPTREVSAQPRVLLLLDDGARMQAKLEGGETRMGALQRRVDALLSSLPPCRVALQTMAGGISEEGSASEIRSRVSKIVPSDTACRLDREISVRRGSFSSFDAVVLGGDREPDWGEAGIPANLHLLLVGVPSRNVGWASLFRTGDRVMAVAKNFSPLAQSRKVKVEVSGRVVEERPLDLAPGEAREIAFDRSLVDVPVASIRLDPPDEFVLDDSIHPGELPRELRVRVPSDLSPSLAKVFAAIPGLQIVEAHGTVPRDEDADLFLRDVPANSTKPAVRIYLEGGTFTPSSVAASVDDSLGRLLGFEGVRMEDVHRATAGDAPTLAHATEGSGKLWPLLWREGESLVLNFSIEKSDWDRHPSFPVFWAAWIEEIRSKRGSGTNFLRPDQSDTNGVSRELDRLVLPPKAGSRQEPLSNLLLIAAAISFLFALVLESRGR